MPAFAQDKAKTMEKAAPLKTEKVDPKEKEKTDEETIDLDVFFKKGEENAKKGMGCEVPAEPVA